MLGGRPECRYIRQVLPLFDVAAGRVLNRLLLAFSGDACAFGSGFRGILLRDPADPVRPPAALGLGRARDKIVERRGLIVAGPILIFARCGRSEEHTSELQSLMPISYA